jgi:hypothetical protein
MKLLIFNLLLCFFVYAETDNVQYQFCTELDGEGACLTLTTASETCNEVNEPFVRSYIKSISTGEGVFCQLWEYVRENYNSYLIR